MLHTRLAVRQSSIVSTTYGAMHCLTVHEPLQPALLSCQYCVSCSPQVKDYVREHHFFEKAFVKETRFTGKEQQAGTGESEQLSCEERVVEATPAAPPCQVSSRGFAFLELPPLY